MTNQILNATDETFDDTVLKSQEPVLVDFWAQWCGPCKTLAPILDELAQELAGQVSVAKVDIDENPMVPNEYSVRGVPTLILFKRGKAIATRTGVAPKRQLKEWVEQALKG